MCNRYVYTGPKQLAKLYHAELVGEFEQATEVLPRGLAPGLLGNPDGERELHLMQFGFCPPGCPTKSDPKRALNNARVESVAKWPWKDAFRETRCVLPLLHFREPCYWGPTEGTEVCFARTDGELMHAAGLYRTWQSDDGSEQLHTMALIMRPALPYVMDHGHHRPPLFINKSGIDDWADPEPMSTDDALQRLRRHAADPDLSHEHVRSMADSWTKRRAAKVRERDKQLEAIADCGDDVRVLAPSPSNLDR